MKSLEIGTFTERSPGTRGGHSVLNGGTSGESSGEEDREKRVFTPETKGLSHGSFRKGVP